MQNYTCYEFDLVHYKTLEEKAKKEHIRIIRDVIKDIQCDIKLLKLTAGCIFKESFSACPVKQIKVRLEAKSGVCGLSIHLADRMIFH